MFSKNKGINPIIYSAILALVMLSLFRVAILLYTDEIDAKENVFYVLTQGVRVDLATVAPLYGSIALFFLLCNILFIRRRRFPKSIIKIFRLILSLSFAFLTINEVATFSFIDEYGVRPNYIYVEYLEYPYEVFSTIIKGHTISFIATIVLTTLAYILAFRFATYLFKGYRKFDTLYSSFAVLTAVIITAPLLTRSTFGHRPFNPSMIAYSESVLANSIPLNSTYSAAYAITHRDEKIDDKVIYALASYDEINKALGIFSNGRVADLSDEKCKFNAYLDPVNKEKRKNVIIVLEESFGANFVGSLGGLPLAPNFDRHAKDAWFFKNMYATGHRSIRGIEAVSAGFPPSPMLSIVKAQKTGKDVATLLNIYKSVGYKTSFIYGGESHFDNMRNYFIGNGAELVIDERDYDNPSFVGSWGVSDEDLFNKADEVFEKTYKEGHNFFSVVFSSSFHDPFDIPGDKVSLPKDAKLDVNQSARYLAFMYADYALGKFIDKIKTKDYYKDTIILVIADHESQVRANNSPFPLYEFRIPAMIIGDGIKAREDLRLASQIDMAPTLLSLSNIKGSFPLVGLDLNLDVERNYVPMQYNEIFALRDKEKAVILAPQKEAIFVKTLDDKEDLKVINEVDKNLLNLGVGVVNMGPYIYQNEQFHINCIKADK